MPPHVLVSYDDTQDDRDALALGRALHELGGALTLAYVRHAALGCPDREAIASHTAHALLDRGAALVDDPSVECRVVVHPSTSAGLAELAGAIEADVIVFGSEYRTPAGHVAPGRSAQALLENGPAAVALAPAGFADVSPELDVVAVLPGTADEAAIETAYSIAGRHEARVTDDPRGADLIVVGSRPEAREGRVMVSARAAAAIEQARVPVLVVGRDAVLSFETLATV